MKTELQLNKMILDVTRKIRERNPELLKFMNEMPITIPYQENPEIAVKTLTSYYDSLAVLYEKYDNTRVKNSTSNKV